MTGRPRDSRQRAWSKLQENRRNFWAMACERSSRYAARVPQLITFDHGV